MTRSGKRQLLISKICRRNNRKKEGEMNNQEIMVKIARTEKYFYIQYGGGANIEKIKISDLPWSVRAILNTYFDSSINMIIETEED